MAPTEAMTERIWLAHYPQGVPADVDVQAYPSLVALMEDSFTRYAQRVAFRFMGASLGYAELDRLSVSLAGYLQSLGLVRGDRVAVMLPNVPQYPVTVAAILRAGYVVVNVNPLYTARELEHQLKDSGATAIVILENFANTLERCLRTTGVKHIVVCAMGDLLGPVKGTLVNFVVRKVKGLVPDFQLPGMCRFNAALAKGRSTAGIQTDVGPDDVAVLQYTGGTTGVAKGAVLLHRHLVANVLQSEAWNLPAMRRIPDGEQPTGVCALPLYHIFAFTISMMLGMRQGGKTILIPNPRDLPAVFKELARQRFHSFPAVNSLFNAMLNHPDFGRVDWSHLTSTVGGGTSVQRSVAQRWLERTGCAICEGYGLSETSPSVCCNPADTQSHNGSMGLPLPNTWVKLIDEEGHEVGIGQSGEIAVRGPQVMAGYWQRPDETAKVMTADGYMRTGDIGVMDARGFFSVVDRKKDMILVSGFNVFPTEVEEVVSLLPGVLECACVGVADPLTGEAVKLVVVKKDPQLGADALRAHCRENLTGYKQPKYIEFRPELPKTPVGKILRRALREPVSAPLI